MSKNRKTRLFRSGSMSNKQRDNLMRQATRYASTVDALCISLVKSLGSSMKEGEWSMTLTKDETQLAKPHEKLVIVGGPNGEIILTVQTDPDVLAQIGAFKAEMNQSTTGTSPVMDAVDAPTEVEAAVIQQ